MADAHDDWVPCCLSEQAVELRLGVLVECRRRLVQENEGWLSQEYPGKGEPLLFAKRQALRPVIDLIELGYKRAKTHLFQRCSELLSRKRGIVATRIEQCAG